MCLICGVLILVKGKENLLCQKYEYRDPQTNSVVEVLKSAGVLFLVCSYSQVEKYL